jgi:methylphosphotriester-DNA--protein-cysteine methyltransferase
MLDPLPRAPAMLTDDQCYQAMLSRDRRFDGVFFVGVSSTGIYCRPVCVVKPPRRQNCSFHPSAAAAEQAGYRPCLRCRPELAPGKAQIDAVGRLAAAAARQIEQGALTRQSLRELAADLGVGDRHLRRVIRQEFGVSGIQLAQTQRLLLAKRLLTESTLSIADIAFASGFSSVRRFNIQSLPGIGEWTAQYIAMRVFADPDAFPHGDLGIRRALGVEKPVQVLQIAEEWRPWRAYAAMYLWSKGHGNKGDKYVLSVD